MTPTNKTTVLFKPSKDFQDLPGWGNKVLNLLRSHSSLTSSELVELTEMPPTNLWVVIEHLDRTSQIELGPDGMSWQLTKQQRIKDRKNASRNS